jgi:1-acyl-sn-glycerol-3-phosphate acyltransferase
MIKTAHNFFIYRLFQILTLYLLKRKFKRIEINDGYTDYGLPVLVISNHISWWDGFWIMYLNLKIIHRKFHFMMLEEQLEKHWYFKYSGAYPIRKKSKSIIESLNYTSELLKDNRNMVFIFPQGEICSLYNEEIQFQRGVGKVIRDSDKKIQIVFLANFVEYLENPKQTLFMYLKTFTSEDVSPDNIEEEYKKFYRESLNKQKTKRV